LKPANVTFEQAGSVAVAAGTALQGLRDQGRVKPGQKVLINGASGGVGTFAGQIAKAFGAEVTGVRSTRNVELVRSIGADHVIDYTKEDFAKRPEKYDVVIDNAANHSLSETTKRRPRSPIWNKAARAARWSSPWNRGREAACSHASADLQPRHAGKRLRPAHAAPRLALGAGGQGVDPGSLIRLICRSRSRDQRGDSAA
jgi:threonine dehydrogenase-like Zn-dependent dehydrogenase